MALPALPGSALGVLYSLRFFLLIVAQFRGRLWYLGLPYYSFSAYFVIKINNLESYLFNRCLVISYLLIRCLSICYYGLMKRTSQFSIAASMLAQHLNLTQPQWLTLLKLSREPGINQASLAVHLDVNPVTVAQSVDRLVKAGLVLRERQEHDRRAVSLYLTEKAEPLLEELNEIAEQTRAIAFAGFSVAEAKVLEDMLVRVKKNFCNFCGCFFC